MLKRIIVFLWLCPSIALAQFKVTGKVTDITTKKPVENASVFIANATIGTKTAEDGSFTLLNVKPGQYEVVVSILSFETYRITIDIKNTNLDLKNIEIVPRSITLNEVKIKPDPNWERNYQMFKREFLGQSLAQCKILNPQVINIQYDANTSTLSADSYEFIEIENQALGYKLKYLLNTLNMNYKEGRLYYEGSMLFEDLKGSSSKKRKWQKARLNAYYGSSQHFLRSVIGNRTAEESFRVMRLLRTPNPARPSDSLIRAKLRYFRRLLVDGPRWQDSIRTWNDKSALPKINQTLVTTPLQTSEYTRLTDQVGVFALTFKDYLYVVYTKKKGDNMIRDLPMNAPDNMTSILTFNQPYVYFDNTGIVRNPGSVTYEGSWASSRVGDMLPVDYEPTVQK